MAKTEKLEVVYLATTALTPNPRNPKEHPEKQVRMLASAIRESRTISPIFIDDDRMILAGHGRWLAAKQLGIEEVPTITVTFASDEAKRAFILADNRVGELGRWNDDLVQEELQALFEVDFPLDSAGFTTADLEFSVVETPNAEEVELPDPQTDAVTRRGDLWIIGDHRIICGDARDAGVWETLVASNLASMIFCDMPYNVPIDGFVSGKGVNRHREFAFASGEMTPAEFTAFMRAIMRNCTRFSKDGSIHYQCMDWRHIREILDAADGIYTEFKQLIVWNKEVGAMGTFYRNQHELVLVFKNGQEKHINNFGLGDTGRYRTNVVSYPGANVFRKGREADLAAHSTVKPTALVMDFLLDCSHRGDLVVDACLGSGTTLLAAEHTGRAGAGIEIDPLYVDTALKRVTAASGKSAVLAGDGRSFDEIAASRLAAEGA
ncbi:site-specific DNA-methyltransferase [Erythrobacter sp.]|uniref:site-specific DNA-methyltransferase n=1 Tax=Erythrobacter sp. TaxID=1042 RepID=UPI003C793264